MREREIDFKCTIKPPADDHGNSLIEMLVKACLNFKAVFLLVIVDQRPKPIFFPYRCDRYLECNEIICGLNLFKGLDEPIFEKLLEDIRHVRSRGVLVKLAFGGEQWGNFKVPTRVSKV